MRGLANDVASDGITSNAVLPGLTNTPAIAPQSEEQKRATWEQQAIKRPGEPEDMAGAILFLTSDDAAFITGQAIVVDGVSIGSARAPDGVVVQKAGRPSLVEIAIGVRLMSPRCQDAPFGCSDSLVSS